MKSEQELKKYIESNIDVVGFTKPEKYEIIDGLIKNISTAFSIAVFERLNEKEQQEFLVLSSQKPRHQLSTFITTKIHDFPLLVSQTADRIIQEFNELRQVNF